jgi:hypothetical protein
VDYVENVEMELYKGYHTVSHIFRGSKVIVIIQRWDGSRPKANPLYYAWLKENNMTKSSGGQIITCKKCNTPRVLYSISSEYKHSILEPCKGGDSIESTFECLNCGEMNKIYWDKDHVSK